MTKATTLLSALDPRELTELILEATAPTTTVDAARAIPIELYALQSPASIRLRTPDEPSLASVALAPFAPEPLDLPPSREPTMLVTRVVLGRPAIERALKETYRVTATLEPPPPTATRRERPRRRRPRRVSLGLTAIVALALGVALGLAI